MSAPEKPGYVYHVAYRTSVAATLPGAPLFPGWPQPVTPGSQERYGDMIVTCENRVTYGDGSWGALHARARAAFVESAGVTPDQGLILTDVSLLATPADGLDDEEWRDERNVAQLARDAAYCWQEMLPAERTFIGGQAGYSRLANALDALSGAVNRPVTT